MYRLESGHMIPRLEFFQVSLVLGHNAATFQTWLKFPDFNYYLCFVAAILCYKHLLTNALKLLLFVSIYLNTCKEHILLYLNFDKQPNNTDNTPNPLILPVKKHQMPKSILLWILTHREFQKSSLLSHMARSPSVLCTSAMPHSLLLPSVKQVFINLYWNTFPIH